jgi:hypothetical protein
MHRPINAEVLSHRLQRQHRDVIATGDVGVGADGSSRLQDDCAIEMESNWWFHRGLGFQTE